MKRLLHLAIITGVTPLTVGILIFISWYFTRTKWLMFVGIFNIYVGLALFCIGLVSICIYAFRARKARVKGWGTKSALVIALLISNFPVAWGLIEAANYIMSTSVVIVDNASVYPIEKIMLHDSFGESYKAGTVAAGEHKELKFHFRDEVAVKYDMNIDGKTHSGILFGYIMSGPSGSTAIINLSKDGALDVHENFSP